MACELSSVGPLLDLIVGHKHTRRSRMSWSASSGMGLCASLVCSLFSSGVSCGWVLSGAVGCCRVLSAWLSGAVGACRVLSGLSGLSGCRGCRGVSGLSGQPCKRTHILTDIWLSELSGCRGVGWCRVVSGCRGGVGLVSDDSVGLSSHPSGLLTRGSAATPRRSFWSGRSSDRKPEQGGGRSGCGLVTPAAAALPSLLRPWASAGGG